MRFLVTAGPTREHIDEVRFLSNASSGRMGFALAQVLCRKHDVTLVAGPVSLSVPPKVDFVGVTNARQMRAEVLRRFAAQHCVMMTAAVADYRPARRLRGKRRKSAEPLTLELVPNPDILAELGRRKRAQVLIGFALESSADSLAAARRKLKEKNLDAIVLNTVEAMGAERLRGALLLADGSVETFGPLKKEALARRLERLACRLVRERS